MKRWKSNQSLLGFHTRYRSQHDLRELQIAVC